MYSVNRIIIKPFSEYQHQFALCESCFWCATIFDKSKEQEEKQQQYPINDASILQKCPLCKNKSISLMPLEKDEGYRVLIGGKRGLEMQFSKTKK
jgi:hypothetical protein